MRNPHVTWSGEVNIDAFPMDSARVHVVRLWGQPHQRKQYSIIRLIYCLQTL